MGLIKSWCVETYYRGRFPLGGYRKDGKRGGPRRTTTRNYKSYRPTYPLAHSLGCFVTITWRSASHGHNSVRAVRVHTPHTWLAWLCFLDSFAGKVTKHRSNRQKDSTIRCPGPPSSAQAYHRIMLLVFFLVSMLYTHIVTWLYFKRGNLVQIVTCSNATWEKAVVRRWLL